MATPIFIATEGMTGKQLMAKRKATAVASMQDTFTLSNCIKAITKNDQGFLSNLKGNQKIILNPIRLAEKMTPKEHAQVDKRGGFTYTLVMNLMRRVAIDINTVATPTKEAAATK